jgi:ABC-type uncharacterized transport system ATPase subunit
MVDHLKEGKDPYMTATIAAAAVATDRAEGEAHGGTVPAIRTQGLTKHYRTLTAVDQLTMQVSTGVVDGFVGLNGAGETTTIRILLWAHQARRRLG